MNSPTFSVIIPVYNAAASLRRAVESVRAQSFTDWECIIINDGSSDQSLVNAFALAAMDARIKVKSHDNQGVSFTRNVGWHLANGKYVAFLDADDTWQSEKLATHLAFHRQFENADISFAQISFMNEENSLGPFSYSSVPNHILRIEDVIGEHPICTMSNVVARTSLIDKIGGFANNLSHAEDQEWLARAISKGCVIQGIDHHLVDYYDSPNGLSSDLMAMYDGWQSFAETYVTEAQFKKQDALYCRYLARRALRGGSGAWQACQFAFRGARADQRTFFANPYRGGMTILCAGAALFIPQFLHRKIFA
ncbi:hypothetical protein LPB140_01155 [Sphingorhabdus lutea]|uniref:Glycosyltransferase 2-like domain-containing protein n=1 Tax=Sphingorhabdus lutea TaxID=1913578 RepID=A0A1L3J987_9SPHN|nr:glycosyltransferase family A protein [Sphingorhabdus lutea]APG61671.1 hypothetical protein LPB140_01155 [Sphingorhabdus lutea]